MRSKIRRGFSFQTGFDRMRDDTSSREIDYSRAAYEILLGLDTVSRAHVGGAAAAPEGGREIAPGLFSVTATPRLRVVLRRDPGLTTILALTGDAALRRQPGRP